MVEVESHPERVAACGCLLLTEVAMIGLGAYMGGAVGAAIGALVLPSVAVGLRWNESSLRKSITEKYPEEGDGWLK